MSEINVDDGEANVAQDERIQQLEERLARMERERAQRPMNLREAVDRLVPAEVRQHLRAARREQLLAVRSWIDVLIERIDQPATASGKRRRIDVD